MAFNHEQKCQLKGEMTDLEPFSEAEVVGHFGVELAFTAAFPETARRDNAGATMLGRQRWDGNAST
ncbi:MAG: hypothetical protein V8Q09_01320 [Adlercreutzia sp.]